jgi:uncharacterized integral membrane protein (TIGR00698 family)
MTKLIPGLLAALAVALVAIGLGGFVPLVGAPVFAIVLGALAATVRPIPAAWAPGARYAAKTLLQASIVILGTGLDLGKLVHVGAGSLPVMLGTMAVCLVAASVVGRWLGLDRTMHTLLGVGTAICGASAIAAVSTVIVAEDTEIAYAISTVFLYNVIAVVTFPAVGHLLAMTNHAFGLFAGTAINDTSSVVAAGYAYSQAAGNDAVVVKLTRASLIVPLVAYFALRRGPQHGSVPWKSVIPWFIVWFVVAVAIDTLGGIPAALHPALTQLGLWLIVLALAGVGLGTNAARMRAAGMRPIVLGGVLWLLVSGSSLAIAALTGVR